MPFQYSQKLIEECIKCFKEENNLDITPEQANEFLDSFAGLFLAFADRRPVPEAVKTARDGARPHDNTTGAVTLGVSNT